MRATLLGFTSALFASQAWTSADTDTLTWGGDNSRAGYQPNHNMNPKVVGSSDFDQIFKTHLPGNFKGLGAEQIFASPLVHTGSDDVQYVYVATTQNNIYKLDAKTGAIVKSRTLHVPFLQAELESCVDINPLIGITATGVIDPDTGIWYVTSKTYSEKFQDGNFSPTNPPGRLNGRYYQHAIHTEDLFEVEGWPVLVDGTVFRNNPSRMFIGGNQHSRPGALLVGEFLYTGYASHCVQYNFTGAIIGFDKKTGRIVEAFATEGGPEPNTVKGGGVWMSGGGLASDGKGSMYFATGNGYASQLKPAGNSVPGRYPPTALEQAAVNAKINDDGTLSIIDFFMPAEKVALDGADKDLGATPLQILPSDVFSCPNHRRIGIITGKSGKTYWLDLDNLGGYQMGPGGQDAVIQVFQNENSVYAGAGVLPLGSGYVYISVTQFQTHVFQFSCDASGNAAFTKVADTPDKNAFILGTGHGTTTSLGGQAGSGLLWTSDVEGQGLRIYDAMPPSSGGPLTAVKNFTVPGVTKFSRPVFGDGRVYIGTNQGYLYGFGSPVNAALNCTSTYDFGNIPLGNSSESHGIECRAVIETTVNSISLSDNSTNFHLTNVPTLPLKLSPGDVLSVIVRCTASSVRLLTSDITIKGANAKAGYASITHIGLKATGHSVAPVLAISPDSIVFSIIAGQNSPAESALFWNYGDSQLDFTEFKFSLISPDGPWVRPTLPGGSSGEKVQVGDFVFTDLPGTIEAGKAAATYVAYLASSPGNSSVWVKAFSNGGSAVLHVTGVAGSQPKCVIEFQTIDGSSWVPYTNGTAFSFETVYEAHTRNLLMRITNGGGPEAAPLSITVSKPPYGIPGIIGKSNNIDLAEGTSIPAGQSQTANLYCSVPKSQVNLPGYNASTTWTLNTGDPTLGKQNIPFTCRAATEQVGRLLANGTAQYAYIGCFKENDPGRQLATLAYSDAVNNTIGRCVEACAALNYTFAGAQYRQECWCGNAIPVQRDNEENCNYGCTGNAGQTCGGDGVLHNAPHISLFADALRFDGNTSSPPLHITPGVGAYAFVGCFAENGGKALSERLVSSNDMTVEKCAEHCTGAPLFGLEYGSECACGTRIAAAARVTDTKECGMTCKGSNSEYCGGGNRMLVYGLNGTAPTGSSSTSASLTGTASSSSAASSSSVDSSTQSTVTRPPDATSSTATPSLPSTTAPTATPTSLLSCPASNGTQYATPAGLIYQIECFLDHAGNDIPLLSVQYTPTLEACIALCERTTVGCVDVSYVPAGGGACYLKSGVGAVVRDGRVWGARLVGVPAEGGT